MYAETFYMLPQKKDLNNTNGTCFQDCNLVIIFPCFPLLDKNKEGEWWEEGWWEGGNAQNLCCYIHMKLVKLIRFHFYLHRLLIFFNMKKMKS